MNSPIRDTVSTQLKSAGVDPDLPGVEDEIRKFEFSLTTDGDQLPVSREAMNFRVAAHWILDGIITAVGFVDGKVTYRWSENDGRKGTDAFTLPRERPTEALTYRYFLRPNTAMDVCHALMTHLVAEGGRPLKLDVRSVLFGAAVGISNQLVDEATFASDPCYYTSRDAFGALDLLLDELRDVHAVDDVPHANALLQSHNLRTGGD